VHPFAGLPNYVLQGVPRVLFNMERVGNLGSEADDVLELGDCDTGVRKLADELGWRDELETEWRKLVGDEEAERQLAGAAKRVEELQDEVNKLADEVEEVLRLQDSNSPSEADDLQKGAAEEEDGKKLETKTHTGITSGSAGETKYIVGGVEVTVRTQTTVEDKQEAKVSPEDKPAV